MIHAAGTQALEAGATVHGVLEVGRALAESVPVVLMCYANLVLARGHGALRGRARGARHQRPDRPRPPARGGRRRAGGVRRGRRRARRRSSRPTTPDGAARRDRRAARAASSTRSRSPARPASAGRLSDDLPGILARTKAAHGRAGGARLRHRHPRGGGRRRRRRRRRRDRRLAPRARRRGGRASPPARCASWWPGSPTRSGSIGARMGLLLTTIAASSVWIVLWALGVKSFDACSVTILMILIAGDRARDHAVPPGQPQRRATRTAATSLANAPLTGDLLRGIRRR